MTRITKGYTLLAILVLAGIAVAGSSLAGRRAELVTLPEGTPIAVRLEHAIASNQH